MCGIVAGTTKKPPPQPVNINTATAEELQHVPGIGPATAAKILKMRKSYGAFKSVDDLLAIRGIGKKRLEKMAQIFDCRKNHRTKSRTVRGESHDSSAKATREPACQTVREIPHSASLRSE